MRRIYIIALIIVLAVVISGGCTRDSGSDAEALRSRLAQQEETIAGQRADLAEAQSQAGKQSGKIAEMENSLKESQLQAGRQAEKIAGLERALKDAQSQAGDQAERTKALEAEMKKLTEGLRVKPFTHEGLFYDPEHIKLVKANTGKEPWNTALRELQARAQAYLSFTPQPIRGRWNVPSPNEDPETQDIAVKPLEDSSNALLTMAQYYLFSGGEQYARKATEIATAWTGSLMELDSQQALFQAGWEMLTMALAADMLRDYPGWKAVEKRAFEDWLNERTWHIIGRDASTNNHRYWIAAQAAAVGVLTDDPGLFQWAVAVYKNAIGYDIAPDGHMPQETARAELGIFYQNFAVEPLALISEIAGRQGIDLWGYKAGGKDLKLAMDYLFSFFDKPETWPWSRKPQNMSFVEPALGGKKVGWFEMAYSRYKDPEIAEYLLERRPVFDRRAGGMTTLTHGLPLQ